MRPPAPLEPEQLAAYFALMEVSRLLQHAVERHLRRMQSAYAERLDALRRAIERSGAPLQLRPVHAGMHAIVDVAGASAERVHAEAAALGVESMPLSSYYQGAGQRPNALFLGFGAVPPTQLRTGVTKLARAIEAVRRAAR